MSKSINMPAVATIISGFSLEAINEELSARQCTPVQDPQAGASLLAMGCRSLDEFTATIVNLSHGTITPADLHPMMVKAFPGHKIGDRHAPHYLSLSRTGSLSGNVPVRFAPAKATRKASAKAMDLSGVDKVQLAKMLKAATGTPLQAIIEAALAAKGE